MRKYVLVPILAAALLGCDKEQPPSKVKPSASAPITQSELHLAPQPETQEVVPEPPSSPPAIVAGPDDMVFVGDGNFSVQGRCPVPFINSIPDRYGRHVILTNRESVVGRVVVSEDQRTRRFLVTDRIPTNGVYEVLKNGIVEVFNFLEPATERDWEVRDGVTASVLVFPSDVKEDMVVEASFNNPVDGIVQMPLSDLPSNMNWWLNFSCGGGSVSKGIYAAQKDTIAPDEETSEGGLAELALLSETVVPLVYGVVGKKQMENDEFFSVMRNFARTFHPYGNWFDNLPESKKLALMDKYGPTAVRLLLLVNRSAVDTVAKLTWDKVHAANPMLENDAWPHHDVTAVVNLEGYDMSRFDLYIRLFLARRGEAVAKKATDIMRVEMAKK